MDFIEVIKRRRMVRNFKPDPVDPEVVERLMDLARRGPSAGFTQGQAFVVVTEKSLRQRVAGLCYEEEYVHSGFDPWLSTPPVLVVPCTSEAAYHRRYQESDKLDEAGNEIAWPVPYWFMDVGCAVMALLLATVNEGLAAGFAGTHKIQELKALLDIPEEFHPVGVIPIGHPAPDRRSPSLKRGRKSAKEIVRFNRW